MHFEGKASSLELPPAARGYFTSRPAGSRKLLPGNLWDRRTQVHQLAGILPWNRDSAAAAMDVLGGWHDGTADISSAGENYLARGGHWHIVRPWLRQGS